MLSHRASWENNIQSALHTRIVRRNCIYTIVDSKFRHQVVIAAIDVSTTLLFPSARAFNHCSAMGHTDAATGVATCSCFFLRIVLLPSLQVFSRVLKVKVFCQLRNNTPLKMTHARVILLSSRIVRASLRRTAHSRWTIRSRWTLRTRQTTQKRLTTPHRQHKQSGQFCS